jgi:hypothetical protein
VAFFATSAPPVRLICLTFPISISFILRGTCLSQITIVQRHQFSYRRSATTVGTKFTVAIRLALQTVDHPLLCLSSLR